MAQPLFVASDAYGPGREDGKALRPSPAAFSLPTTKKGKRQASPGFQKLRGVL